MARVRIGIIGCGVIGNCHLEGACGDDNIEVVAVADLNGEAARQAAGKFNVRKIYGSASELIDDPNVDAVVLALITGVRTPIAIETLQKGKHLLVEKPPAMNVGELQQIKAVQGNRIVGCCSSRYSFFDGAERARKIVESEVLGAIRVVRCRGIGEAVSVPEGNEPPPWRISHRMNGGGFLVNHGVYDLDYLMHITGWQLKPRTVLAQTWPIAAHLAKGRVHPDSDAENHVLSLIRCDDGSTIVHERGESVAMRSEFVWQITGEKGSLHMCMTPADDRPILVLDEFDAKRGMASTTILKEPGENHCISGPIRNFAAAIRDGVAPKTDIDKAMILQSILDAVYESARTGQSVRLGT